MNSAEGITINDLLRLPILKDAKVISGEKGLNRIVRYIDIMEVPDVKGWLREGELLLTTAYSIRHDPELLSKLVESLAQAGVAALAIKPERFIHDMPLKMIQISNAYQLPIIQLPSGIPYMDITHAVMEQIIDKQASLLRRSEEVLQTLTKLVLENKGIQAVADNVASLIKSPIWLIDKSSEIIVSSPVGVPYNLMPGTRYWDISVDRQLVGKLIIDKEVLDDVELVCVEQARLVFSLELLKRKTALDTEIKLRGDFIEELLTGLSLSQQEVVNKARYLGLTPENLYEIVVIESEKEKVYDQDSHLMDQLSEVVRAGSQYAHSKSHIHKQGKRLVLLLASGNKHSLSKSNPNNWEEILISFFKEHKGTRIGFGGESFLWDARHSYLKARKAIMIGSKLDNHQQAFIYEHIEMFELLLEATENVNMEIFVAKKIDKLCQNDKDNGTEFVKTLFYYISSNGSLVETANHLFIHRNSVKYRMDKIREIVDTKLDTFRERFIYYFCIIYYLNKPKS